MTTLNNPASNAGGDPGIGWPEPGTSVTVGLVDIGEYQQTDYETREPKTWSNGDPMMGTKITGIVHAVEGCEVGPRGDKRAPELGERVAIFVEGGRHRAWKDASKAFEQAGNAYEVGDLVWFACTGTADPTNPRHNPRKVYEAKIGKQAAEHADLVAACKQAYQEKTAVAIDPFGSGSGSGSTAAPF